MVQVAQAKSRNGLIAVACVAAGLSGLLGGCAGGNYSSPELSVTNATLGKDHAVLGLEVYNPSSYLLFIHKIDYTLECGPLPVARGSHDHIVRLGSQERARVTLDVPFQSPPLDTRARVVRFRGVLELDESKDAGPKAIRASGFDVTVPIEGGKFENWEESDPGSAAGGDGAGAEAGGDAGGGGDGKEGGES